MSELVELIEPLSVLDDRDLYDEDGNISPFPRSRFQIDSSKRTISGLVLPWGRVAQNEDGLWRFVRGSLRWSDPSRIKLLLFHDKTQPVGRAISLDARDDGLYGTFKVARGVEGDRVLQLAEDQILDGFSIGPAIGRGGWEMDPQNRDVRLVTDARLVEVTLTAVPAFDEARVQKVNATRKGSAVTDTRERDKGKGGGAVDPDNGATVLENEDSAVARFEADLEQRFTALSKKLAESAEKQQEQVANTIAAAFDSAFQRLQGADARGQGAAAAARWKVIKEPPTYRFDGDVKQPSLVRDSWNWHHNGDYDARDRLRKFQDQQADIVKFQQIDTTVGADVIPPGYRPDLFVTQLMQGRPVVAQASRGTITDATPFTVPRFVSMHDNTGGAGTQPVGDHTEGTNPLIGRIVVDSTVVQPLAMSGIFELTREIVDSSNPAIDAIAMQAMRESWNQQAEVKAYAALNGAAAVSEEVADLTDGVDLIDKTRDLLARYPFSRFAAPTGAVISQAVTRAFSGAKGTDGRPLLPSVGAQNTAGLGNAVSQGWFIDGLAFVPAWAITENLSDDVELITNRADWWVWESPLLTFRFEEKKGPALVELALFGYYASHVLRNAGIFALRRPAI